MTIKIALKKVVKLGAVRTTKTGNGGCFKMKNTD